MAEKNEIINYILEQDVDFKRRRIYFGALQEGHDSEGSSVTWRSVERVIRSLHIMEAQAPNKPIELWMNSGGGDAHAMLRLYDAVQSCSCQVKFYGGGEISSAATWIMAGCDERYVFPNTRICIHDSAWESSELTGKLVDRSIDINEDNYLQVKLNQIYADNSIMPLEFWGEMVKRDLWISAEEAITLGLADDIVKPKKRGNLRRKRIASMKAERNKKDLSRLVRMLKDRIYMDKLSKIEVHVPEESFDKTLIIDNTPMPEDVIEQNSTLENTAEIKRE